LVPLVLRPDTRAIVSLHIDSLALSAMVAVFRAAYPNEAALCLVGTVRYTVIAESRQLAVRVTGAIPAQSDSADPYHVFFPAAPRTGCASVSGLIGAAHDHTSLGHACTHSYPDADVLFGDPRLLFTLVFCADGMSEVLYQDGRRVSARWAP